MTPNRFRKYLVVLGAFALITRAWGESVFNVNSVADGIDADLADGNCEIAPPTVPPTCTLRAAVMQANRIPSGAKIFLPAGTYFLTRPPGPTDGEDVGDLDLVTPDGYSAGPTTIIGAGAATTIIDGMNNDGVITIGYGRTASISAVSILHGKRAYYGGLENFGTLTLVDSVISNNTATAGAGGGGIYNAGSLTAMRVAVSANVGGGILNGDNYTLSLTQTTISGNTLAGGIKNFGYLYLTNSTISANSTLYNGGGIENNSGQTNTAHADIYNSTIVFNQADSDSDLSGEGSGIYVIGSGSIVNVVNSVIAGNSVPGSQVYDDCIGALGIYGNNKFSVTVGWSVIPGSPGTATLIDSLDELGILTDNGGPTRTVALKPPSTLIGGGATCVGEGLLPLKTDQRGHPRPPGSRCDIGAFEYNEIFWSGFESQ